MNFCCTAESSQLLHFDVQFISASFFSTNLFTSLLTLLFFIIIFMIVTRMYGEKSGTSLARLNIERHHNALPTREMKSKKCARKKEEEKKTVDNHFLQLNTELVCVSLVVDVRGRKKCWVFFKVREKRWHWFLMSFRIPSSSDPRGN